MQEARRQRMLELHGSQRPRDRKPPTLGIAEVRDMLLLDSDKQTLTWLRPFNPLLCVTPQGEAALLLTRDTAPFTGTNNPAAQSLYILDKAYGAPPVQGVAYMSPPYVVATMTQNVNRETGSCWSCMPFADRSIPEAAQARLRWAFEDDAASQRWRARRQLSAPRAQRASLLSARQRPVAPRASSMAPDSAVASPSKTLSQPQQAVVKVPHISERSDPPVRLFAAQPRQASDIRSRVTMLPAEDRRVPLVTALCGLF